MTLLQFLTTLSVIYRMPNSKQKWGANCCCLVSLTVKILKSYHGILLDIFIDISLWQSSQHTCMRPINTNKYTLHTTPHYFYTSSPPVDIIGAMMIVWRIRGKIIRTVHCCVVYNSCTRWYAHIWAVLTADCSSGFNFNLLNVFLL